MKFPIHSVITSLLALILIGSDLAAQSAGSSALPEQPGGPEDSWQQRDMKTDLIEGYISSGNPDHKLEALDWISRMIEEDAAASDNIRLAEQLETLALEPFLNPRREGMVPSLENDHPLVRKKTAVVLGDLGGQPAADILVNMLKLEGNPDVLKDVMYSLGRIALNENMEVTRQIGTTLRSMDRRGEVDNELAYASLFAIHRIALNELPSGDEQIYDTLLLLYDEKFSRLVHEKAREVLELLWKA